MKFIYAIILFALLTSCTKTPVDPSVVSETPSTPVSAEEITVDETLVNDIVSEVENLANPADNQMVTLDGAYKNPQGPVDMKIKYSVNADGLIQTIDVAATTYDISNFNKEAQTLIGKPLSEAENFYVAGASLTSDSFTQALKNR